MPTAIASAASMQCQCPTPGKTCIVFEDASQPQLKLNVSFPLVINRVETGIKTYSSKIFCASATGLVLSSSPAKTSTGELIVEYEGTSAFAMAPHKALYPSDFCDSKSVLMNAFCKRVALEPVAAKGIVWAMGSIPSIASRQPRIAI